MNEEPNFDAMFWEKQAIQDGIEVRRTLTNTVKNAGPQQALVVMPPAKSESNSLNQKAFDAMLENIGK